MSGEGPGHRPQVLALNPHQEHDLGEQAYREVLKKYAEVKDGKDADRVRTIGQRIARAAEIEPLQREINLRVKGYTWDWEFRLLKHPEVNAFCLPGGKVAVFTGLMPVAENDDQLATVMAHEIAHALAHHASERVARARKYETAVNAVNGALGRLPEEDRRHLIGLLGAGAQAKTLAYDRQQESEADHIGLFLMTFAGYDPDQALVFWQRMQRLSQGKQPPEILSDHPSDAHRIEQIRNWKTRAVAAKQAFDAGRIAPAR
jgi:predicted Zn-dependent protease